MSFYFLISSKLFFARNEGKIKSIESCTDLRSWSHDAKIRDKYLREWIKSDTRVQILSVSELAKFLRKMTFKTRGKASPRCQQDCKSKHLLESICSSCYDIKQHFKTDKQFEKYFEEEAFETSHWPCDKCLEALKSIRMFWKIIVEKVYNINFTKIEEPSEVQLKESVRTIAESWKNDIAKQTFLLRSMSPESHSLCKTKELNKPISFKSTCSKSRRSDDYGDSGSKIRKKSNSSKYRDQDSDRLYHDTESFGSSRRKCKSNTKKHIGVSARVKTVDYECNTDDAHNDQEELQAHKSNIEHLQRRHNYQKIELNRLLKENTSLKFELQNIYKKKIWMSPFYSATAVSNDENDSIVPEPFEKCSDCQDRAEPHNVNSEITITMENFKCENFKNVSLLKVVHKSNEPINNAVYNVNALTTKTEDPMNVLSKLHNTFGEIVKREMSIVKGKREISKRSEISASSQRTFKSVPSCTSVLTFGTIGDFTPTKDCSLNELCLE